MPIVEPDAKSRVGQQLKDRAFKFDQVFFCQAVLLVVSRGAVAPLRWIGDGLCGAQIDRRNPAALTLLELIVEPLAFA